MKKIIIGLVIGILIFGFFADTVVSSSVNDPRKDRWQDILKERLGDRSLRLIYTLSVFLNMLFLLVLLIIYLHSFRNTKSYFTLGLSFFIGVLLMQRIMFFFFPLVPQLFETLALAILLVLSLE
jgi:hypothetical protein